MRELHDGRCEDMGLLGAGAMEHISPDLWDDPRFVLYAVQRAPGALEHAQADIKVRCWGSLDIGVL